MGKGSSIPTFRPKFANSKPLGSHTYITSSMGEHGQHKLHDTTLVQTLLKSAHAPGALDPLYRGRSDGRVGTLTIAAIKAIRTRDMCMPQVC